MKIFDIIKNIFNNSSQHNVKKSLNPAVGGGFDYTLDDPAVPNLTERIETPPLPNVCPMFTLQETGNLHQEMQVYSNIIFTLNFVQPNLLNPINRWSSTNNLCVFTRAGQQFNAYYDRDNLKFFFDAAGDGSIVYTCDSPDIVSHELGHAILDSIRPDLWNTQCLESAAFHEAFGDTMAILSALHHDKIINAVLAETNNNIGQSNLVSRLAEQMGIAINKLTGGRAGMPDALRNAVNNFTYVEPETLPYQASDDQLAGECHSFSRVFAGAWYKALVNMYELELTSGTSPYNALVTVRDAMTSLYLKSLPLAPNTHRFYAGVANAMVACSKNYCQKYTAVIKSAFAEKRILKPDIKILSSKSMQDYKITNDDTVWKFKRSTIVRKRGVSTFKIPASHNLVAMSANLNNVEIDVPHENYMEFDAYGNLVHEMAISQDEANQLSLAVVNKLLTNNEIAYGSSIDNTKTHTQTHIVVNNKLQRLYFN